MTVSSRSSRGCEKSALLYKTVARWIKTSSERRRSDDMRRLDRPSVNEGDVQALAALLTVINDIRYVS